MKAKQLKRKLKNMNGAEFIIAYNKYLAIFENGKDIYLKTVFIEIAKKKNINLNNLEKLFSAGKIQVNSSRSIVLN